MPLDRPSAPARQDSLARSASLGRETLPEPALGALRAWSPPRAGSKRENAGGRRPQPKLFYFFSKMVVWAAPISNPLKLISIGTGADDPTGAMKNIDRRPNAKCPISRCYGYHRDKPCGMAEAKSPGHHARSASRASFGIRFPSSPPIHSCGRAPLS